MGSVGHDNVLLTKPDILEKSNRTFFFYRGGERGLMIFYFDHFWNPSERVTPHIIVAL